jgi:predicted amidophosphoribosyltransferase
VPESFLRASRLHLPYNVKAACTFEGETKNTIVALKYRNRRRFAKNLAARLFDELVAECGDPSRVFDVCTWAPTTDEHRRRRGMDHAELIARELGKMAGLPVKRLLRRRGSTTQTGRSRDQRLVGPTFMAHPSCAGRRILVIDDVTTTGSTLRAARRACRSSGAETVECWAVAATP